MCDQKEGFIPFCFYSIIKVQDKFPDLCNRGPPLFFFVKTSLARFDEFGDQCCLSVT
jgi:hypothetical protein